jgi:hypothetical protein
VADLDTEAARLLIEQPGAPFVRWSTAAIDHAMRLCARQPFYLQHLCREVFESRRVSPLLRAVTVADLEEIVPVVVTRAEEHLDDTYDGLPHDLWRAVIRRCATDPVLAEQGSLEDQVIGDVRDATAAGREGVLAAIEGLIDLGVLERSGPATVRIRAALLHHRVRLRHPWESP